MPKSSVSCAPRQHVPLIEYVVALGSGDDETVLAARLIGDDRTFVEILQDGIAVSGKIEIERVGIVRRRDPEIGAVGALEIAAVVVVRRPLRLEDIRIVDGPCRICRSDRSATCRSRQSPRTAASLRGRLGQKIIYWS